MSRLQTTRNEIEMLQRRLEDIEQKCNEQKENYEILWAEAENKVKLIEETRSKLFEAQTELSDIDAYLNEIQHEETVEENEGSELLKESEQSGKKMEEVLVDKVLALVKERGVGAVGPNGKEQQKEEKKEDLAASLIPVLEVVKVTLEPDSDGGNTKSAVFQVVRNYTFGQLFEDCCRFWDLFPPDFKLANQNGGKWHLELVIEKEAAKTPDTLVIRILPFEEEEVEEVKKNGEGNENDEDNAEEEIAVFDQRKQWPPPLNRKILLRELIIYIAFIIIYIVFIGTQRDTESEYFFSNGLKSIFAEQNYGDFNTHTYNTIGNKEDLTTYIYEVLVPNLFDDTYWNGEEKPINEKGFILNYNKIIGGVQFKQHRVKKTQCQVNTRETQHNASNPLIKRYLVSDCYGLFSQSTASKESYGNVSGIAGFSFIKNPGGETDTGILGYYPSSAFIRNITLTPLTTKEEFLEEVTELLENDWLDSQTRAVLIQFVVYNANFDLNLQLKLFIEVTPAGEYQPRHLQAKAFRIFKFNFDVSLEIFSFFIIVGFLLYYGNTEYTQARTCNRITGSYKPYLLDVWNFIEAFIIISTCWVVGLFAFLFTHNVAYKWTYFRNTYPEMQNYIYIQQRLYDLFAVNIFLLVFKLFKFFPLVPQLGILSRMLSSAAGGLAYFLLMLVVLFIGFVVMANMIFGVQLQEFTRLEKGFVYLYLYLLGNSDYESLKIADRTWGPIFFSIYMVLFVLVMLNVFVAILNDAYDLVNAEEEKKKIVNKTRKQRSWKDYEVLVRRAFANLRKKRKTD
eukprot:c20095_g1_i3.p1 GENE.c20095_g1_i3~~c20095_g1_i3.p1  ORF type:complete len:793 (+),score=247.45 c20095_g1_i3:35-2413(+)